MSISAVETCFTFMLYVLRPLLNFLVVSTSGWAEQAGLIFTKVPEFWRTVRCYIINAHRTLSLELFFCGQGRSQAEEVRLQRLRVGVGLHAENEEATSGVTPGLTQQTTLFASLMSFLHFRSI